jgi:2-keto-4-pentenoate hydratase
MNLAQIAQRQLDDYDRRDPGSIFADYSIAMTIADAYALQIEVARLRVERGELIAGYKVGCISPVMQVQLGIDRPVFGFVFETEIRSSVAVLDPSLFAGLAVEGELAVRIARDIPDADWLRSHPDEALSSAFAVIELHNYTFRNTPHTAPELIGNNAIHAGVVLPMTEPPLGDPRALPEVSIQVSKNGDVLGVADGRALAEGPFGSVVRLAEHLAGAGQFLRRGQIVLTGSPLPLYRVSDGDRIEVSCNRSSTVAAHISSGPVDGRVTAEGLPAPGPSAPVRR